MSGHPNKRDFSGVLALVDRASDKSPNGARGHKVMLTKKVAEDALPSLLGMGVNFDPDLNGHNLRSKCGVITGAEVVGKELRVRGHLYERDCSQIVVHLEACAEELGMSYEMAEVQVKDMSAKTWILTRVIFTGAAILKREKAAYRGTRVELTL